MKKGMGSCKNTERGEEININRNQMGRWTSCRRLQAENTAVQRGHCAEQIRYRRYCLEIRGQRCSRHLQGTGREERREEKKWKIVSQVRTDRREGDNNRWEKGDKQTQKAGCSDMSPPARVLINRR